MYHLFFTAGDMKKLLTIVFTLLSLNVQAESQWSVGVSHLKSNIDVEFYTLSYSDIGHKINLAYTLTKNFAIEVAHHNFGDILQQPVLDFGFDLETKGESFSLIGILPFND